MPDPRRSAVLCIDVQNDYCAAGGRSANLGRGVEAAEAIVPNVRRVLDAARGHGVPVIYVCMQSLPGGASDSAAWVAQRKDTGLLGLCARGSWGEQVVADIAPHASDVVIAKHRYSAFTGTGLETILRSLARDTLVFTGVATNTCVESSVRDAFDRDFFCVVVEDGVAGFHPDLHAATLANVRNRFGQVVDSYRLAAEWALGD